jgi:hypothetical protein
VAQQQVGRQQQALHQAEHPCLVACLVLCLVACGRHQQVRATAVRSTPHSMRKAAGVTDSAAT